MVQLAQRSLPPFYCQAFDSSKPSGNISGLEASVHAMIQISSKYFYLPLCKPQSAPVSTLTDLD